MRPNFERELYLKKTSLSCLKIPMRHFPKRPKNLLTFCCCRCQHPFYLHQSLKQKKNYYQNFHSVIVYDRIPNIRPKTAEYSVPNIRYRIFGEVCRYADNGKSRKNGHF